MLRPVNPHLSKLKVSPHDMFLCRSLRLSSNNIGPAGAQVLWPSSVSA